MMPPASAPPVAVLSSGLPVADSSAMKLPSMSPAKVTPPAVGVMPATTGPCA